MKVQEHTISTRLFDPNNWLCMFTIELSIDSGIRFQSPELSDWSIASFCTFRSLDYILVSIVNSLMQKVGGFTPWALSSSYRDSFHSVKLSPEKELLRDDKSISYALSSLKGRGLNLYNCASISFSVFSWTFTSLHSLVKKWNISSTIWFQGNAFKDSEVSISI